MNTGVKRELLFGYGLVFILVVGLLFWAIINQVELWSTCDRLIKTHQQSATASENMTDSIEELNILSLQYAIDSSDRFQDEVDKLDIRISEWMEIAKRNTSNKNEKDILSRIENNYSDFHSSIIRLTSIDEAGRSDKMSYYKNHVLPSFIEVRKQCFQLRKINIAKLSAASERAKSLSIKGIAFIVVFAVVTTVAGIFIFGFLARLRL